MTSGAPNYSRNTIDGFVLRNASESDIQAFSAAIAYLSEDPWARAILYAARNKEGGAPQIIFDLPVSSQYNNFEGHSGARATLENNVPGTFNAIYWKPKEADEVFSTIDLLQSIYGNSYGVSSSAQTLLHEFLHATDPNLDKDLVNYSTRPDFLNVAERYAVLGANVDTASLGEPQHFNYYGVATYKENNPTEHVSSGANSWQEQSPDGLVTVTGGTYTSVSFASTSFPERLGTALHAPDIATFSGGSITATSDTIDIGKGLNDTIQGDSDSVYEIPQSGTTVVLNGSAYDTLYFAADVPADRILTSCAD